MWHLWLLDLQFRIYSQPKQQITGGNKDQLFRVPLKWIPQSSEKFLNLEINRFAWATSLRMFCTMNGSYVSTAFSIFHFLQSEAAFFNRLSNVTSISASIKVLSKFMVIWKIDRFTFTIHIRIRNRKKIGEPCDRLSYDRAFILLNILIMWNELLIKQAFNFAKMATYYCNSFVFPRHVKYVKNDPN